MRLSVREVARLFEVSERTVYRWIAEDELPAYEVEGQSRFQRAEVLEWATARDLTPAPELFENEATAPGTSVAAALERGGIHAGVEASTREAALSAIIGHLPVGASDRELVGEVLRARPDLGKTGLVEGIAIPHVRHPIILDVPASSATLCFLSAPLTLGPDATPVHTVFTLVTPTVHTHLVILSRLAFTVHDPKVREALQTHDAETILGAVRTLEAEAR
jgi:PTS system nitrogen regulatory IIA component